MSMYKDEEKCCGNCCWFCYEETNGWGMCACQKGDLDSMHCSDMCEDNFVSRQAMRHHMAVLLLANRWRRDESEHHIYKMPNPKEFGKAIDFSIKYMKTFSKL